MYETKKNVQQSSSEFASSIPLTSRFSNAKNLLKITVLSDFKLVIPRDSTQLYIDVNQELLLDEPMLRDRVLAEHPV